MQLLILKGLKSSINLNLRGSQIVFAVSVAICLSAYALLCQCVCADVCVCLFEQS